GHKESIYDSAKVFERMVSIVIWRTYAQSGLEELASNSVVPVVNALTDDYHPCQVLADLQTIREQKGTTQGLTLTYLGDAANNMDNTYLLGGATADMNVRITVNEGYLPGHSIVEKAKKLAQQTSGSIQLTTDANAVLDNAVVVVTDT